jgi:hypothetical protein
VVQAVWAACKFRPGRHETLAAEVTLCIWNERIPLDRASRLFHSTRDAHRCQRDETLHTEIAKRASANSAVAYRFRSIGVSRPTHLRGARP